MANPLQGGQSPDPVNQFDTVIEGVKEGVRKGASFVLEKLPKKPATDQSRSLIDRVVTSIKSSAFVQKIQGYAISTFDKLSGGKIAKAAEERANRQRTLDAFEQRAKDNGCWDNRNLTPEQVETELKFAHPGACLAFKRDNALFLAEKKDNGTCFIRTLSSALKLETIDNAGMRMNHQMNRLNTQHAALLNDLQVRNVYFPEIGTSDEAMQLINNQIHREVVWHDPLTNRPVLSYKNSDGSVVNHFFTARDNYKAILRHYQNVELEKAGQPPIRDELPIAVPSQKTFETNFTYLDYAKFLSDPASPLIQDMKHFPRWDGIMVATPAEARAQLELAQLGAVRFVKDENNEIKLFVKEKTGIKDYPWTKDNILEKASFIKRSQNGALKAHKETQKFLARTNFIPHSEISPNLRLYPDELSRALHARFSTDPEFTFAFVNIDNYANVENKNHMLMLVYRDQETGELKTEAVDSGMDLAKVLQSKDY